MDSEIINKFKGVIYGQAIGDALGLGTEFMTGEDIMWKYPDGIRSYSQILQDKHRRRWKIGHHIPMYAELLNIAYTYDSQIARYIELAWQEKDVTKLMDDEHMGYTLLTLSVALWAYWHAESFVDGLLKVVNAGGDADTNAAVACAILGAKFGFDSIPAEYIDGVIYRSKLEEVTTKLEEVCSLNPQKLS